MTRKILAFALTLCLLALALCAFAETVDVPEDDDAYFLPIDAKVLNGEGRLTEEYFAGARLTFINYWATWCGPCVQELPDLAKLSEETNGDVQVLGVLMDAIDTQGKRDDKAIGLALEMLEGAEATYPVVYPEGDMLLGIIPYIDAVPTTFIVDETGRMVTAVVGSRSLEAWAEISRVLLQELDKNAAAEE